MDIYLFNDRRKKESDIHYPGLILHSVISKTQQKLIADLFNESHLNQYCHLPFLILTMPMPALPKIQRFSLESINEPKPNSKEDEGLT